jgi:peptide/nickel transport system ATP-binding protein
MMASETKELVLEVRDVEVSFGKRRGFTDLFQGPSAARVKAVNGVSFQVRRHETLGLVGESGSGKTTLGRALLRLYPVDKGEIRFLGRELTGLSGRALRALRRDMQLVFQDPYSSLNPRFTIGAALAEVLRFHEVCPADEVEGEVHRLLDLVGLSADMVSRRPASLSGGQRQRVGLARALAPRPKFLVLDEPVAALDVSIQAQVLNLLKDLRDELGLTMLFIAHELSVVRHMSTRVAVMYLGQIVEIGTTMEIFERPSHPYTRSLLRAVPRLVAERRRRDAVLKGEVPSPIDIPPGCPFHPRCPAAEALCSAVVPPEKQLSPTQVSRCHFAGQPAILT